MRLLVALLIAIPAVTTGYRGAFAANPAYHCPTIPGTVPAQLVLYRPLVRARLTPKQVVAVVRHAGWGVKHRYVLLYGSLKHPGGKLGGPAVDVWELRESKITAYDPEVPHGVKCPVLAYHHFLAVVDDKSGRFVTAADY